MFHKKPDGETTYVIIRFHGKLYGETMY